MLFLAAATEGPDEPDQLRAARRARGARLRAGDPADRDAVHRRLLRRDRARRCSSSRSARRTCWSRSGRASRRTSTTPAPKSAKQADAEASATAEQDRGHSASDEDEVARSTTGVAALGRTTTPAPKSSAASATLTAALGARRRRGWPWPRAGRPPARRARWRPAPSLTRTFVLELVLGDAPADVPHDPAEHGVSASGHVSLLPRLRTRYAIRDCRLQSSMKPGLACWEKSPPDSPKPASAAS